MIHADKSHPESSRPESSASHAPDDAPAPPFSTLERSLADAERCVAAWFRARAEAADGHDERGPEARDLNTAITALRRLIDARKALRELEHNERTDQCDWLDEADWESTEREFRRVLGEAGAGGEIEGDADAGVDGLAPFCP